MKIVNKIAAQGDVIFRKVSGLPKDAVAQVASGQLVVAHSETGHHHIAQPSAPDMAVLFTMPGDPLRAFIKPSQTGHIDIVHHRPWDTHETLRLLVESTNDVWEIRRQREHAPEGWRQVMD